MGYQINTTDLYNIYNASLQNKTIADDYFKQRHLINHQAGFIYDYGNIKNSIIYPVFNATNILIALECRDIYEKRFIKLKAHQQGLMLYNINNAILNRNYVIITEGIFDAESLIQNDFSAIAILRATLSQPAMHLLTYFNVIYLALDNDEVGIEKTKMILEFYKRYYPNHNIQVIEYYGKDINESLIVDKNFKSQISQQLSENLICV